MLVNLYTVNVQEWIKDPKNIYIGRQKDFLPASKWQNPYPLSRHNNNREEVVRKFEQYIRNNFKLLKDIHHLKGKSLGCLCHPKLFHGDILAQHLQETMADSQQVAEP